MKSTTINLTVEVDQTKRAGTTGVLRIAEASLYKLLYQKNEQVYLQNFQWISLVFTTNCVFYWSEYYQLTAWTSWKLHWTHWIASQGGGHNARTSGLRGTAEAGDYDLWFVTTSNSTCFLIIHCWHKNVDYSSSISLQLHNVSHCYWFITLNSTNGISQSIKCIYSLKNYSIVAYGFKMTMTTKRLGSNGSQEVINHSKENTNITCAG